MVCIMRAYTYSVFVKVPTCFPPSLWMFATLIALRKVLTCVSRRLQSDPATAWRCPRSLKSRFLKETRSWMHISLICLEGSNHWVSWLASWLSANNGGDAKTVVWQLLPICISSIKSVVLPNPTTKHGRFLHVHALTAESKNTYEAH